MKSLLPRRERNSTELSDFEESLIQKLSGGLTHTEISIELGMSQNAISRRVTLLRLRAKAKTDAQLVALYLSGKLEYLPNSAVTQ